MTFPKLKLTYFDGPGRAEPARLALSYGQISFEDERLDGPTFQALKPTLPLGQVPILTVDGQVFAQSLAINRYVAKLAGLYPQNSLQALRVDMVIDTLQDLVNEVVDIKFREKDEGQKAEKAKAFLNETAPRVLAALEKMIGTSGFFLDQISLADIVLFHHVEHNLKGLFPEFSLDAYPKVLGTVTNVKANANIAKYLSKHNV